MTESVLLRREGSVAVITLHKPEVLNAWDAAMRTQLLEHLQSADANPTIRAIVLTGAGDKAFSAGQDLRETKKFDPDRAEEWISEWERLYGTMRSLSKPLIAALNGVAAGSAFQVTLMCDLRIGHPEVKMGQPEIKSGIVSTLGPWIMREILGIAKTIELTLTGRMMGADECLRLGLLTRMVPREQVLSESLALAQELAQMPPLAMRLDRQRFKEMTEPSFRDALAAGVRMQRESYGSGEPQREMEKFLAARAARK